MKFAYIADLHGKGKNSINRLGNYFQNWLLKLDEVIDITKKETDGILIIGGDLFDSPNISNTVIDEFVDRIENANLSCYIVPGNHDEIGHNWELSKSSALAHIFRRSKNIKQLTELDDSDFYIKGYEYNHNIESELKENGLKTDSKAKCKIAIPHAFISIKPFFKDVSHILAKDIDCDYNIVLCSHFHMDFDETINGVRFININCFGRTSIKEQHIPKIAIVNTETMNIEIIELKSAKKSSEIFDLTKYNELKANEKDISEFIEAMQNINLQEMNIANQITTIAKEKKIDSDVLDYIMLKLSEVE